MAVSYKKLWELLITKTWGGTKEFGIFVFEELHAADQLTKGVWDLTD